MTIVNATQQQILKIYGTEMPKDSTFTHPSIKSTLKRRFLIAPFKT